jgi:hypothetical protein
MLLCSSWDTWQVNEHCTVRPSDIDVGGFFAAWLSIIEGGRRR